MLFASIPLLPLDDCLYALQESIPHLTRSSLHRCLKRHEISRLPDLKKESEPKKKFKDYPIGFFHIDITELRTQQGKLHLFVAIDRTSKFVMAKLYNISKKIKAAERRLDTLAEHLAQAESLKKHRAMYQKAQQLPPKKHEAFCKKHAEEIQLFESAKRHFEVCMTGRTVLPIKTWKAEQAKLFAERYAHCDEYYKLKEDVRNVEVLRRSAEEIMRGDGTLVRDGLRVKSQNGWDAR